MFRLDRLMNDQGQPEPLFPQTGRCQMPWMELGPRHDPVPGAHLFFGVHLQSYQIQYCSDHVHILFFPAGTTCGTLPGEGVYRTIDPHLVTCLYCLLTMDITLYEYVRTHDAPDIFLEEP